MLEVEHLSVDYRGVLAVEDISFAIAPGQIVGMIGPNGAGKSTLVKALLGLLPMQGRAALHGAPLQRQRHRVAYVPQRSQIDWDYPITAWNVVMMARTTTTGWLRQPSRQSRQIVQAALERVNLLDLAQRQIGQLSGGQQQRVFLARALAQQADLFFLDEPFTGIDKKTEAIMLGVFAELRAQGKTLLICSHEWGDALQRYDRLLLLNRTLLANDAPQSVMTLENIQRAYGENLHVANRPAEMPFC
ncbi:MAG: ABC transporter ATP-binding protein [Synechococcales cyanobacterium C42_A2020_086]|jgi:manganese/iron transport system ATP-binding protein|nr:ABC transporter ATP-binding protein [Synechococcales cyanobacterium C42_A2020_086]